MKSNMLGLEDIKKVLPHRKPFLMIDRALEVEPFKHAVCLKEIGVEDHFLKRGRRGISYLSSTLLTESMAQTAGLALLIDGERAGIEGAFVGIRELTFIPQPVEVGGKLRLEADFPNYRKGFCSAQVAAFLGDRKIAEGLLDFLTWDRTSS